MRIGLLGGGDVLSALDIAYQEREPLNTPFGRTSAGIREGRYADVDVFTMLRHGPDHAIPAHEVNYRANVYAFSGLAVNVLIGVSVCGSFRADAPVGTLVVYDQIIDFTRQRAGTFFGAGNVRHTQMLDPTCEARRNPLVAALESAVVSYRDRGTLVVVEGPRFSTRAESRIFRQWGADYINMSAAPEAFLARELGMCYLPLSLVTDGDDAEAATVSMQRISRSIAEFSHVVPEAVRSIVKHASSILAPRCNCANDAPSKVAVELLNLDGKRLAATNDGTV